MKAAKFFSICEIVCFVGLALSYAGEFLCAFVAQGTDKDIFQMGLFLFWLLIGPLAICNLICAAVMYIRLLHCAHPVCAETGCNRHRNRSPAGHFPVYLRC